METREMARYTIEFLYMNYSASIASDYIDCLEADGIFSYEDCIILHEDLCKLAMG